MDGTLRFSVRTERRSEVEVTSKKAKISKRHTAKRSPRLFKKDVGAGRYPDHSRIHRSLGQ